MTIRIGQGIDIHAFDLSSQGVEDKKHHVVIGGVAIPYTFPIVAHSDGDVLLHSLCDALLGALALGDIGHHFPDTDKQFKGADSRILLRHCVALVREKHYSLVNADLTIVAQQPKMAPYIQAMRENIAEDTNANMDAISVKATTSEFLGFTGRKEGIACFATVLLEG